MRILITGADGFIGRHLIRALTKAGHEVLCCVRNPKRAEKLLPGLRYIACDFSRDRSRSAWIPRLQGVEAVINAAGIIRQQRGQTFDAIHHETPCALFDACESTGVKKVIQISALGADDRAETQFHLSKKKADDYLAMLDLDWIILQPSIVYGPGGKSASLFKALAALPVLPLVGDGQQTIQPIYIDDLASAVVLLMEPSAPTRIRLQAVGPEAITLEELLETFRQWLAIEKTRRVRIPLFLARSMVFLGDIMGASIITSETLRMLLIGNTADPTPFINATGIRPKSLKEVLNQNPSQQADQWHARLYFLRPLLRFSIAFVWISAGLVSAFLYPREESYRLLAQAGISGVLAPLALYGASAIDVLLGILSLVKYRIRLIGSVQLVCIVVYSAIIFLRLPEFWLHPFGPLTKNFPLFVAILVMMAIEDS